MERAAPARMARSVGFETTHIFVTAGGADECAHRVRIRGLAGGHAAPEAELRVIYARSMANLLLALDVFERIELYDNAESGQPPRFVGEVIRGRLVAAEPVPDWVPRALR